MSNLYKQYFVQNQPDNARVIDPNTLLEARRIKELERQAAVKKHQEELARSFEAGIVRADTDFIEIEEDEPVDEVADATEEAERILSEAKAKSDAILNQAYLDAKNLKEDAKMQGFAEANVIMKKELEEERTRLRQEYEKKRNTLDTDYTKKRNSMEQELVNVIIEVFNKVFHIQFDSKKDILLHLINNAILNIEDDRKFRIKVADSNVLFLENHREDILERVGQGIELEFVADSAMDGNACQIETDSGIFDCGLDTQLENLIKDIKSLSS